MAINWSHDALGTKISCSQISADTFEATNLLTGDKQGRKQCFRVEYFVKPPIDLIVDLPIAIDVQSIEIGLRVGERKTTGFELWFGKKSMFFCLIRNDFFIFIF